MPETLRTSFLHNTSGRLLLSMIFIYGIISIIIQQNTLCTNKTRVIYFCPNCVNFLPKTFSGQQLYKRDSDTGVFLRILQNFTNTFFIEQLRWLHLKIASLLFGWPLWGLQFRFPLAWMSMIILQSKSDERHLWTEIVILSRSKHSCHFWNNKSVSFSNFASFFSVMRHNSSILFFSWNFIYFRQKGLIKVQIWWNFTWPAESLKFCTLMGSFCPNQINFQLKKYWRVISHDTKEWCKV